MNRFQDRKLNKCRVCHTKKLLAITFDVHGKAYFLCKGHAILNDLMIDALNKHKRVTQ